MAEVFKAVWHFIRYIRCPDVDETCPERHYWLPFSLRLRLAQWRWTIREA